MALRKILASIIASVWLPLDGSGTLYGQPVEEGKIYWTEARDLGWIQRSNLDGSNLESLLTTDIVLELKINPRRIALDRFGKIPCGSPAGRRKMRSAAPGRDDPSLRAATPPSLKRRTHLATVRMPPCGPGHQRRVRWRRPVAIHHVRGRHLETRCH